MSIYDKASLVLIPSGTKTSKVYSQKPMNGDGDFTFSRSTAATRVNASGNIEKETQNLLLQSNSFNTTWTSANVVATSGQAGYDGTNDAWKLEKFAGLGNLRQTISSNGISTLSFYVKAGNLNWTRIIATGGSSTPSTWFDLQNGVVGSADFFTIDANIESVGSDWYRCSITFEVGSFTGVRIYPADGNNDVSGTSGYIYIQSAQLEQSLVARTYIETTTTAVEGGITDNVPRLDYTDSSCPALLLEPQRTNGFPHSEYLGQWSANRLDRTANNVDSPEGVQNAYKMAQQSGFTTAGNINYAGITAGTKTLSIFAKAGTFDHIALSYNGVTYFNLTNGTIGTTASGHTAVITDMGDGWYRCAITKTTTATYTAAYYFAQNNGTLTTTDTQGYMYAYGAMIETGSYATSYIPTYGSAVTRNADSCSKTGISSLIGQTEGTFFAEFEHNGFNGPISQNAIYTRAASSTSNYMYINVYNGRINVGLRVNSTTLFDTLQGPSPLSEGVHKCAFAYKSGDIVIYLDGQSIYVPSNNVYSNLSLAELGVGNNTTGGNQLGDGLKQVLVFKTRLSNEELATLTTI